MRSLMSSNPVTTAKQDLNSLFDENRKKVSASLYFISHNLSLNEIITYKAFSDCFFSSNSDNLIDWCACLTIIDILTVGLV